MPPDGLSIMSEAAKLAIYYEVADVKPVLHIDLVETSEDAELASCISIGSGIIDVVLMPAGLVVPSTVMPRSFC
jgi:hypothetical protein